MTLPTAHSSPAALRPASNPHPKRTIRVAHSGALFINGVWIQPHSGESIEVISPDTEEVVGVAGHAGPDDMDRAVDAARRAFDLGPWSRFAPEDRRRSVQRLATALEARHADLNEVYSAQVGVLDRMASILNADANATLVKTADLARSVAFVAQAETNEAKVALVVREPVGVVAAIAPWNVPYDIMISKVAPALLAGCTVVMKPAPETPFEAAIIAEAAEAADLPAGVVNFVPADRAASDHLVRHPDVDKVSFTGSTAVGRRIAEVCGSRVARTTLELGGKSAAIVCDDADIDHVARLLTDTIITLSGQICSMLTRVIVPRHRHDALAAAIARAMAEVRIGHSHDPAADMGPLAMKRQLERVEHYVARGVAEGADLVAGGCRPRHLERGYFIEPTLFANVDPVAAIAQDEIFGPVLCLIPCRDELDAVRIANDTRYGLNGSVLTRDADTAYRIGRALRTGMFAQNGLRGDFCLPYGGFKESGIGREGGVEGILSFTETKTMLLDDMPTAPLL